MRSANGWTPPTDRQNSAERGSPSYSAEQRETVQRGLRLLARIIARSHLRRQASLAETAPDTPRDGKAGE